MDVDPKHDVVVAPDEGFVFGKPKLHELGYSCCGKPQGCTNPTDGCAYKQHPFKRFSRGEITLEELNRINPPRGMELDKEDS